MRPRFLVTAGNTREKIDRVRDWGNIFTGNTGFSIATALAEFGEVDLVTSNQQHLQQLPEVIRGFSFGTHAELMTALERRMAFGRYDGVFMTAAVSDYTPAGVFEVVSREQTSDLDREFWIVHNVNAGKVKSTYDKVAVLGSPTRKIVDCFRDPWDHRGLLVKFKLEVGITPDELIAIGQRSRGASGADYLVANTLEMVDGDHAGAYLLSDTGHEWIPRSDLAARLTRLAREHLSIPPLPQAHTLGHLTPSANAL